MNVDSKLFISIAAFLGSTIIGLFYWIGRHISNQGRHPKADDLIYEDVCIERGKANEQAHEFLKESIENAIARSDEQHNELKTDMKTGFTKLETLIIQKL